MIVIEDLEYLDEELLELLLLLREVEDKISLLEEVKDIPDSEV